MPQLSQQVIAEIDELLRDFLNTWDANRLMRSLPKTDVAGKTEIYHELFVRLCNSNLASRLTEQLDPDVKRRVVYAAAKGHLLNLGRHRRPLHHQRTLPLNEGIPCIQQDDEDAKQTQIEVVRKFSMKLPVTYRTVIALAFDGRDWDELCRETGLSLRESKRQLTSAVRKLKSLIHRHQSQF